MTACPSLRRVSASLLTAIPAGVATVGSARTDSDPSHVESFYARGAGLDEMRLWRGALQPSEVSAGFASVTWSALNLRFHYPFVTASAAVGGAPSVCAVRCGSIHLVSTMKRRRARIRSSRCSRS